MASREIIEMSPGDLVDRWRSHIVKCGDDILRLLIQRAQFRAVRSMLRRNPDFIAVGSDAWNWLATMWITQAVMGIRRELDDQAGVINIRHLLFELEARPTAYTREAFESYVSVNTSVLGYGIPRHPGPDAFDRLAIIRASAEGFDHLDPQAVAKDRQALERKCEVAFRYAQRLVAHRTPADSLPLREKDIDRAINSIALTFYKYYEILTGETLNRDSLKLRRSQFHKAFSMPWLVRK